MPAIDGMDARNARSRAGRNRVADGDIDPRLRTMPRAMLSDLPPSYRDGRAPKGRFWHWGAAAVLVTSSLAWLLMFSIG